jgi:hypothetical protein
VSIETSLSNDLWKTRATLIPEDPRVFHLHQFLKDANQPRNLVSIQQNRPQLSSAILAQSGPCLASYYHQFKKLGFHRPTSGARHDKKHLKLITSSRKKFDHGIVCFNLKLLKVVNATIISLVP